MVATATNWQDLQDARFAKIFNDRYTQLPDKLNVTYLEQRPQRGQWSVAQDAAA